MGLEAHFTYGYHLSLPKECKRSCATEHHPAEGKLHMAYHRVKFRLLTFLFYINDLPSKLQCTVSPFSDDCLLYAILVNPTPDAQLLQDDLFKLEEWQKKTYGKSSLTQKMFHYIHHPEEKSATKKF